MANVVEVRVGADLANNGKFKGGFSDGYELSKNSIKKGFELAAEYRVPVGASGNWEIGGGLSYKYNKLNENVVEKSGLHAVPVYFTTRYNFRNSSEVTPYIKANLGYSFNSGKLRDVFGVYDFEAKFKGGLYSGLGIGLQYQNFVADLSYNVNGARVNRTVTNKSSGYYAHDKFTLDHGVLTLSAGYSFGF